MNSNNWYSEEGISLLDHYAGLAFEAILGNSDTFKATAEISEKEGTGHQTMVAKTSFRYAKAMVIEAQKREEDNESI